jgi:hypothetical protein
MLSDFCWPGSSLTYPEREANLLHKDTWDTVESIKLSVILPNMNGFNSVQPNNSVELY